MNHDISFSPDNSLASSNLDQETVPSILMSTLSINDGASLVDLADIVNDQDGESGESGCSSSTEHPSVLQTKNELAVLVAMLRAYFEQKPLSGTFDKDFFDLLGHALTSQVNNSADRLLLDVDGDRLENRFFAVLRQEATAFVAFSSATADAWKRSLLPSLVATYDVAYTEERFSREIEALATEIRLHLVETQASLAANQQVLVERTASLEGLLAELLDESLTADGALAKEQLLLEKAIKEEENRLEELEATKVRSVYQGGRRSVAPVESLQLKLRRLTQVNARLTGKRDYLRQQKVLVLEQLDPLLVSRYRAATQELQYTTNIYEY